MAASNVKEDYKMQHDNLEHELDGVRKEKYEAMKRVRELKLKVMENAMKIQSMNEPLLDQYIKIFEEKIAEAKSEQKGLKQRLGTLQGQLSNAQSKESVHDRNTTPKDRSDGDSAQIREMQRRIQELERQNRDLREQR